MWKPKETKALRAAKNNKVKWIGSRKVASVYFVERQIEREWEREREREKKKKKKKKKEEEEEEEITY